MQVVLRGRWIGQNRVEGRIGFMGFIGLPRKGLVGYYNSRQVSGVGLVW